MTHPNKPPVSIDRLTAPVMRIFQIESAGGILLLSCTVFALMVANSPWSGAFEMVWGMQLGFDIGSIHLSHPLRHWINDGLMAVFFYLIGLEIKREVVEGELREIRVAALPIAAAVGGMVVPAAIYLALQHDQAGAHGWGIPMATDIAFVVGCLTLLGDRVPKSLRILLLSLAIADDLGAILVIAIGYSSNISVSALLMGAAAIGGILLLLRRGTQSLLVYVPLALITWYCIHESGVHATVAGVILGLITPLEFGAASGKNGVRPLEALEHVLHPWVSFGIMPLFALANAGVRLNPTLLIDPIATAVASGLLIGKPFGIFLFSWLAIRLGLARLSNELSWRVLFAGGVLAGIGFTMSLFIAGLALSGPLLEPAKVGVLTGSALSAVLGMGLLVCFLPRPSR